jgi:hypothetical protein
MILLMLHNRLTNKALSNGTVTNKLEAKNYLVIPSERLGTDPDPGHNKYPYISYFRLC